MLKARKSAWFERVFRVYNRNLLKRRFHSLCVAGLPNFASGHTPTVVFANHTSWWDGLVCFEIFMSAGVDGYVLMEEKNLVKYPLFRRLGAFSIDRDNPRSALASFDYAAGLVRERPSRSILIFPQGKIVPAGRADLGFESGVLRLIEAVAPCRAIPLALEYQFRGEFKPDIFACVGEPSEFPALYDPTKDDLPALEGSLRAAHDRLRDDTLNSRTENYVSLI